MKSRDMPFRVGPAFRLIWRNLLALLAYFATGRLCITMLASHGAASPLWLPSGFSLAATLLWGPSVLPGVFVGATLTTLSWGSALVPALVLNAGNTLEAFLAAFFLRRMRYRPALDRVEDVLGLVILAGMLSTAVSATIGVTTLLESGAIPPAGYGKSWLMYWTGNAMGIIAVFPLLTVWLSPSRMPGRPAFRHVLLVAGGIGTCLLVFGPGASIPSIREPYLFFPILVWAALDHGPRGGVVASAGMTAFAVGRTLAGDGPFVVPGDIQQSVWLAQTFSGVSTLTALVLGAALAQKRHAVELRDEFISIASHELKTPMTTVVLGLDELRSELRHGRPPAGPLDLIERQLSRLGGLVDAMLDIARLTAGPLPIDAAPHDLSEVVAGVLERHVGTAREAGCTLEVDIPQTLPCAFDRLRLEQVLANLLSNALKYGPGRPVHVSLAREAGEVRLSVKDFGKGIAPEDHGRIFRRFERASVDRAVSGLGLGLYIVEQIVEAHGGTVEVESAPGQGATFTVRMPVVEVRVAA